MEDKEKELTTAEQEVEEKEIIFIYFWCSNSSSPIITSNILIFTIRSKKLFI